MPEPARERALLMADGMTEYVPGVNCLHCGRFVGRDGSIEVEHFEMSSTVASVEGECGRCLERERALCAAIKDHLIPWAQVSADGPLTILNLRNVIWNTTGDKFSPDEVQRALWRVPGFVPLGYRDGLLTYRFDQAKVAA